MTVLRRAISPPQHRLDKSLIFPSNRLSSVRKETFYFPATPLPCAPEKAHTSRNPVARDSRLIGLPERRASAQGHDEAWRFQ
jgi:hypothetical protein